MKPHLRTSFAVRYFAGYCFSLCFEIGRNRFYLLSFLLLSMNDSLKVMRKFSFAKWFFPMFAIWFSLSIGSNEAN